MSLQRTLAQIVRMQEQIICRLRAIESRLQPDRMLEMPSNSIGEPEWGGDDEENASSGRTASKQAPERGGASRRSTRLARADAERFLAARKQRRTAPNS
jgi:hypothetical protein